MKKILLIPILIQFICFEINAIDTIPEAKTDIEKIIWLNNKAQTYLENYPEQSLLYSIAAKDLATSINNTDELSKALNFIGLSYYNQNNYSEAINYFRQAIKYVIKKDDQSEVANLTQKIGLCYLQEKNYRNAISHYQQSLRIYEKLEYDNYLAQIYYDLGILYYSVREYGNSVESLLMSAEKHNQSGNVLEKAKTLYQLGITYETMGNFKNALSCFNSALNTYKMLNNKELILVILNNIASVNIKLKKYSEATVFLNNALELAGLEHIEVRGQIYLNLGNIKLLQKEYKDAELYYEKAQNIASQTNNKNLLKSVYKKYHELYSITKNTHKSLEYYQFYNTLNNNSLSETEIVIPNQNSQNCKEDLYIILFVISLIVNIGLVIVIFLKKTQGKPESL